MKPFFQNAVVIGTNVNPDDYHKENAPRGDKSRVMGRSDLMEFYRCPSRWRDGYKSDATDSTEWGDLMDTLLLSPDEFDNRYIVTPDTYPDGKGVLKPWNWNANHCKDWRAEQEPRICLKTEEWERARTALAKLRANSSIKRLLDDADRQVHVTGVYHDAATGLHIPVQALLDIVPHHPDFRMCRADFKTSLTANGRRWSRISFDRGYHVQAALYTDLANAATGEERTDWVHIVQENFAPYEVAFPNPMLSQEFIELGRATYRQALREYCWSLATDTWPSYSPADLVIEDFQIIEPEPWMAAPGSRIPVEAVAGETFESDEVGYTP